jgi:hypothetical protein
LRIKYECQNNTSYISAFSYWKNIHFSENRPILLTWRDTCISWKIPSTLDVEFNIYCFPLRSQLAYQRNSPYLSVFSCRRNIHFKLSTPFKLNWRDICQCWKNSIKVRSLSVLNDVPLWELSENFKEHLTYQPFQVREIFTLEKIGPYFWTEETQFFPGRIPCELDDGMSQTTSPLRTDIACKRNATYLSPFSHGANIHFMGSDLYCWIEETHVSPRRMPSNLEAAVTYILFPFEDWISWWKEYSLSVKVFKWEKHSLWGK